jgi:hypothetical protein
MSPEREDALRTVLITNLVLAIKRGNPLRTAAGLLALTSVLVDDDAVARIALAPIMREAAAELESGINKPLQPIDDRGAAAAVH